MSPGAIGVPFGRKCRHFAGPANSKRHWVMYNTATIWIYTAVMIRISSSFSLTERQQDEENFMLC